MSTQFAPLWCGINLTRAIRAFRDMTPSRFQALSASHLGIHAPWPAVEPFLPVGQEVWALSYAAFASGPKYGPNMRFGRKA